MLPSNVEEAEALFGTTNKLNILNFPLERQDRARARVKFNPIEVTPPDVTVTNIKQNLETIFSGRAVRISESESSDDENSNRGIPSDLELDQGVSELLNLRMTPTSRVVNIYTPVGLQFSDGVNINTPNLNIGGAVTGSGLAAGGQDVLSSFFSGLGTGLSSIFGGLTGETLSDAGRVSASRLIDALPLGGAAAGATRVALQVTANPNTRAVFGGVKLRSFVFQFKFIAVSQAEAIEIENIVDFFRTELYPEHINLSTTSNIPYGYKLPNLFRIAVQYDVNGSDNFTSIPNMEIGLCYLSDIVTQYNATSSTYHKDGRPNEIDMSLTFTEYKTRHKDEIGKNLVNNISKDQGLSI